MYHTVCSPRRPLLFGGSLVGFLNPKANILEDSICCSNMQIAVAAESTCEHRDRAESQHDRQDDVFLSNMHDFFNTIAHDGSHSRYEGQYGGSCTPPRR